MSIKSILQSACVFYLCLAVVSCVNLRKINDYAAASGKSIVKFEGLGYSFSKACIEKCTIDQLDKQQFIKTPCDCKNEYEADSVTFLLYNAVKGYFDGLTKLSNNEVTGYKYDALTKALKEGSFGEVKINKNDVDSYAKLATVLTRAVTDEYRKRKLSIYIAESNDAIKVLLNALQFNLVSNLAKRLETKRERIISLYFDLFEDTKASSYEKKKVIEEFNAAIADIDTKKKQLVAYGAGLNLIAKGHQTLFENRNKLRAKELKPLLSQYASDIQNIVSEINKLKNQD